MKRFKVLSLSFAVAVFSAAPALAHHSFAMFDRNKKVTLSGTVKEFQWTNPHIWIQVMIPDETGALKEWGFESGSPTGLVRSGWTRRMLSAGDKVTVVANPLRDGTRGGSLITVTLPDGRVMGSGGAAIAN